MDETQREAIETLEKNAFLRRDEIERALRFNDKYISKLLIFNEVMKGPEFPDANPNYQKALRFADEPDGKIYAAYAAKIREGTEEYRRRLKQDSEVERKIQENYKRHISSAIEKLLKREHEERLIWEQEEKERAEREAEWKRKERLKREREEGERAEREREERLKREKEQAEQAQAENLEKRIIRGNLAKTGCAAAILLLVSLGFLWGRMIGSQDRNNRLLGGFLCLIFGSFGLTKLSVFCSLMKTRNDSARKMTSDSPAKNIGAWAVVLLIAGPFFLLTPVPAPVVIVAYLIFVTYLAARALGVGFRGGVVMFILFIACLAFIMWLGRTLALRRNSIG
jgi:hypothetical protein